MVLIVGSRRWLLQMVGCHLSSSRRNVPYSDVWIVIIHPRKFQEKTVCVKPHLVRSYVTANDVGKTGPVQVQPHHLPHRQDYGLRGTSDHVIMLHWFHFSGYMVLSYQPPMLCRWSHILRMCKGCWPSWFFWTACKPALTCLAERSCAEPTSTGLGWPTLLGTWNRTMTLGWIQPV